MGQLIASSEVAMKQLGGILSNDITVTATGDLGAAGTKM